MESSRIFVKNLPPSISEADFRKHFSAPKRDITDCRLIPKRRIGFVGYKSPEEAADAARYFNRSFLRLSKLSVEIARPITDAAPKQDSRSLKRHRDEPSSQVASAPDAESKNKKRKREDVDESNPKVREYLNIMQSGKETFHGQDDAAQSGDIQVGAEAGQESDNEYETLPIQKPVVKSKPTAVVPEEIRAAERPSEPVVPTATESPAIAEQSEPKPQEQPAAEGTDDDWLRSRTNRLLDLVDPVDAPVQKASNQDAGVAAPAAEAEASTTHNTGMELDDIQDDGGEMVSEEIGQDRGVDLLQETARLFVRNLAYTTKVKDLRKHFASYGELEEVHLPVSNSGASKGFAMVKFVDPASAIAAYGEADGKTFQGRILHVLPAKAKRETKLDEFALSKLPLKKQNQIRKKAEAASSTFNWNSLFMDQAAVNDSVAARLGVEKSTLFDPTSADALVQQAIAETTVIQEAKAYYLAHGVDLESFKSQKRGDTTILVKGIPFGTSLSEIRAMFEKFGSVLQVLMPQSGTIAIVQFANAPEGKRAFAALCYSRIKDSILYLEKAPESIFVGQQPQAKLQGSLPAADVEGGKLTATTLLGQDDNTDQIETSSLFVRNLNFSTTTEELAEIFKPLDGFVSARVKTKPDPKHAGQVLSMGFGFVAFRTRDHAAAAIPIMNGHVLAAHTLEVKASHKGLDAAEERKRDDLAKKQANQQTKVVIKNLSFAVNAKELRSLLSNYGKLRSLRIPKKFGGTGRGFAFADFATPREAANAIQTLKDTHLLGRRLVLDYAEADAIDPEEEIKRMEKKVGNQVKKVAMQQLAGRGKARVNIGEDAEDEMG